MPSRLQHSARCTASPLYSLPLPSSCWLFRTSLSRGLPRAKSSTHGTMAPPAPTAMAQSARLGAPMTASTCGGFRRLQHLSSTSTLSATKDRTAPLLPGLASGPITQLPAPAMALASSALQIATRRHHRAIPAVFYSILPLTQATRRLTLHIPQTSV